MRPLRIALGDLSYINEANATNQNKGWQSNLYVPLNVGYLASYAKKKFGKEVEIEIFKDPQVFIEHCRAASPDVIGFSSYYWNQSLNDHVLSVLRRVVRSDCQFVAGGPSIDSDPIEKEAWRQRHGVDIVVTNEGEQGFASIIAARLGGNSDAEIQIPLGLSTDLADVPSPYLDGMLDAFLHGPYQPMVQTSRLCPYTCSFCVSGKSRGKLRTFPLDQVFEEIVYVAKRYADRPDHVLYIVDENFGILERDIGIASFLRETGDRFGYPQKVFFYNDKRFTATSRAVHEAAGSTVYHGVCLSLQSENPETLKAIKRRNLTDEQIISGISWAHSLGKKTSTELIFGLPMETRQTFLALLDKCARLGFDSILCYNLIIFDGIEMNRQAYRDQHKLQTRRRLMHGNSQRVEGKLCVESEEVVVSCSTFGIDDYRFFRALNVWFHAIFVNGLHKQFFQDMAKRESLTAFLSRLLVPHWGVPWSWAANAHRNWLQELYVAIENELYTDEQMADLIANADAGLRELPTEIKLQPIFARKLSDDEHGWVAEMIKRVDQRVAA